MALITGWIFDAYPDADGMAVWVLPSEGGARESSFRPVLARHRPGEGGCMRLLDHWLIGFHVGGAEPLLTRVQAMLASTPFPVRTRLVEKKELFADRVVRVLEVRVPPNRRSSVLRSLEGSGTELYGADIHPVQAYHYDRGHFPLALCRFDVESAGQGPAGTDVLRSWELQDDPWAVDYPLPDLSFMHLSLSSSELAGPLNPNHAPRGRLVITADGRSCELEGSAEEQVRTFARRLADWDPDVLTTDWGDSFLVPHLLALSEKMGVSIPFSRDSARGVAGRGSPPFGQSSRGIGRARAGRGSKSFHTYGRTVCQGGVRYFFGRWHLDKKNSFLLKETGYDGLFEIARIARIPVQRAARSTIGTSLSSMQMDAAWRGGILIPGAKAQAEDFRPAWELLESDKGGLVYEPDIGWHEAVVEYDFVSMYPELMVRRNISPETVNCACCPDNRVPGVSHHLCRRRPGLVPKVLAPILEKRRRYKALMRVHGPGQESYKARASAHKWCLVTCFGYLGFKNARFGMISAHECVTAWGRETLLLAKEAAEAMGASVLHGLVDSLWVKLPAGASPEEVRAAIEARAGSPLALEGVYKWIRFCPSKRDSLSGVPGRYFGAFVDGSLKIRGLACRRRDTPRLLKELQADLLGLLAAADGLKGCRSLKDELSGTVEDYRQRLQDGTVSAEDLAIEVHISKDPESYRHDTLHALAAKQLSRAGSPLRPGESVRYVVVSAKGKAKEDRVRAVELLEEGLEYDPAKYLELLEAAAREVLDGL